MPGAMVEITAADPRQLVGAVRTLPGVQGVLLVGVGVHVHVDSPERLSQIEAALATKGMTVTAIDRVEPTIEDLFVALLEQANSKEPA
jgi:ABC-2 type transport system ATP-binding protein